MLLRKLQGQTNDDGNFVYPGEENIEDRVGSSLHELIDYAFGNSKNGKPVDIDVFRSHIISALKIPPNLLYYPPVAWKKFVN